MNPNMQGHNHGGKNHLFGMLGIGALVLLVLLGTGRSLQQALSLALFLACPLMMVGMMVMMRGGKTNTSTAATSPSTGTPPTTLNTIPRSFGRTRHSRLSSVPKDNLPALTWLARPDWVFSKPLPEDFQDPHVSGGP